MAADRSSVARLAASRPGRILLAVVMAALGLGAGYALVRAVAAGLRAAGVSTTPTLAVLLSTTLLQGVAFGGVSLAYLRVRGLGPSYVGVRVPDLREALVAASGYALALVGAFALVVVVVLAGLNPAQNRAAELGAADPTVFLVLIPISFLLIGPGEELLFRGIVQGTLREAFGAPAAVGLATLIFAAAHVTSLAGPPAGRLLTIALLFLPGLVLGIVYEYTDNLVVPALVHGAYNATLFALAYVSVVLGEAGAEAGSTLWLVAAAVGLS